MNTWFLLVYLLGFALMILAQWFTSSWEGGERRVVIWVFYSALWPVLVLDALLQFAGVRKAK